MLINEHPRLILCSIAKQMTKVRACSMKKDRRIDKSKSALKEALIFLMDEKEFKSITITEIVQSAKLNRGTFYKHYQTQEELLNELIDDVLIDLIHSSPQPYAEITVFIVGPLSSSSIPSSDHVARASRFYTIIILSTVLPGSQSRTCPVLQELVQ